MRWLITVLAVAFFAVATVFVSEGGDVVYYATAAEFGALNALGERLWGVKAQSPLVAADPMGSCLAVANSTGGNVTVYLYAGRRLLWSALLQGFNATAIATDCVRVAVGGVGGYVVLQDGRVVERASTQPVTSLAYTLREHRLVYATWQPGRFSWTDWCGDNLTVVKTDIPVLYVNGRAYPGGYGFGELMRPAYAVSQRCDLAFAVGDAVYWRGRLLRLNDTVTAVGLSGSGDVLAVGTAGGYVYVYVNGSLAATVPYGSTVRQLALSYNGLTLAVDGDAGVRVYRFQVAQIAVAGCDYGVVRAGPLTYRVPGLVFMPYGSSVAPQEVVQDAWRCVPAGVRGYSVYYQKQYAVALRPPAQGPQWASGEATFTAPPSRQVQLLCNAPFCPAQITATFVGWRINGTLRAPALPAVTLAINGPTSLEPLYAVEVPREVERGGARYVLRHYVNMSAAGLPVAENPDVVQAYYDVYFKVVVRALDNATEVWLPAGASVRIVAPAAVENGTVRYVFRRWANVTGGPAAAVEVRSPLVATALYDAYYKVVWKTPWGNVTQWAPAGAVVKPPSIQPYQTADARAAVVGWRLNGQEVREYTADAPAVIEAEVAWTYLAKLQYPWGVEERWLPQGYPLPTPPQRHNLLFVFKRWEPSSVVTAPGVYTAVYELDLTTAALMAAVAGGAIAAFALSKRR